MRTATKIGHWFRIKILLMCAIVVCLVNNWCMQSALSHNELNSFNRTLIRTQRESNISTKKYLDKVQYYMVFSTSCSKFQDWQAMAFFHFAKKVKQPGNVTRLVSGCTAEEAQQLTIIHNERIAPLNQGFQMHITPDYNVHDDQKYWNKPFGLLHWMENILSFPNRASDYNDAIIIIVDPDMMLLRPITHDFTNYKTTWEGQLIGNVVTHGFPIAQRYAYGSAWFTSLGGNESYVVGPNFSSPIYDLSIGDAELYYPAGPPYLATGKDMYAIAKHWVQFLPRVYELFPDFMAEMYSYSVAAAYLGLPHQLTTGFMVSDIGSKGMEGFEFLDHIHRDDACHRDVLFRSRTVTKVYNDDNNADDNNFQIPLVLHYCQRYSLGRWFFSKYDLRADFLSSCDVPLLREPPVNVAALYDWNFFPNGMEGENFRHRQRLQDTVLHAWMMCTMIFSLNDVAIAIKERHCHGKANFNRTLHFHDEAIFQSTLDDPTGIPMEREVIGRIALDDH
jgi:peptidyl serine alpha-galactosyltransferase